MSIVSSVYVLDYHTQSDGRRYVRELHTDSVGVVHVVEYLAVSGADYQAIANARATTIETTLAEQEAEAIINA
jgi:hypothetical protein